MSDFSASLDLLASRDVVLFGGKGGVGKTTIASAAALHFARNRPVILFTTDPASSTGDLFPPDEHRSLKVEELDAATLYAQFLENHLEPFLEIGDRGTYLDRDELRSFIELSLPGVDELMAWMRIGELVESNPGTMIVVDTAPTGHTLRMLSSFEHFHQLAGALDTMQEKHRAMMRQFMRRDVHDAMDAFIEEFDARASRRRELLCDPSRTAFVPVTLSEPLVVEQTERLMSEVVREGVAVPFVVLNRAVGDGSCCDRDRQRAQLDEAARDRLEPRTIDAPRSCEPLDNVEAIERWMRGEKQPPDLSASIDTNDSSGLQLKKARVLFLAGKGGVGKTSCAASIALQRATADPDGRYVVISVDPAHSLRDLFASVTPPPNLEVEIVDTRAQWERLRSRVGERIGEAIDALTPGGMSLGYDAEAMRRLIEIAPPGADEIFAIMRLSDLIEDQTISGIIVDTAPTGHFLRLLALPQVAGEWVREFIRILLRYRELVRPGTLGQELVRASKALKELDAVLRSDAAAVITVTRPERLVIAETKRLLHELDARGIHRGGVIANYVTPESDCPCDASMRAHELAALAEAGADVILLRRERPPATFEELAEFEIEN
ncbi:MAG TPA: ArsA family ATPase [Thermoanaerobaculia bacterium]